MRAATERRSCSRCKTHRSCRRSASIVSRPSASATATRPSPGFSRADVQLVVFDDSRLGLMHDGAVVDVSDLVGAGDADWPPVFLLRAIADFDRLRPRLAEALGSRRGIALDRVRLLAPVV